MLKTGYIRRTEYGNGMLGDTVQEVMAMNEPHLIYWRQLESRLFLNMTGKGNAVTDDPEHTVRLEPMRSGTQVTLSYWFSRVTVKGWLCCCAPCLPGMLARSMEARCQVVWEADMLRRGYQPRRALGASSGR